MTPLRATGMRNTFFFCSIRPRSMCVMWTCFGSRRSRKRERDAGALVNGVGISEAVDLNEVPLARLVEGLLAIGLRAG